MAKFSDIIHLDIANYLTRNYYSLSQAPALRFKRWLQEKYKTKVTLKEAEEIIGHYREIYEFVRDVLPKFIRPSTTGFASPEFVDDEALEKMVFSKFKKEGKEVLKIVIGWAIYYEYLR